MAEPRKEARANESADGLAREEEIVDAVMACLDEIRFSKLLLKSLLLVVTLYSVGCVIWSLVSAGMHYLPPLIVGFLS